MFSGKLPQELTQKNAMYKNWFHNSFWCNLVKGVATGFIIRTTTIQYIHKRFLFFFKRNKSVVLQITIGVIVAIVILIAL